MSAKNKNFSNINFYELIGVEIDADEKQIRKAYRKKALKCHPDKNPDKPQAAILFHELSKALEILTDVSARAAYDKVLKAKKAAELRDKQLDSKRQKLKADLEERERFAAETGSRSKTDEDIFQEQVERLRREGSKLLEEEQRFMREQLRQTWSEQEQQQQGKLATKTPTDTTPYRIKIKWKSFEGDKSNGNYTKEKLTRYFRKYGQIIGLVMSSKNGNAMIEMSNREACDMILSYETGDPKNPLKCTWVMPPEKKERISTSETIPDFEDLVMRNLRQAEERRRLILQIQKEDEMEISNS